MPNAFEEIAEKKKQAELAKHEAEIANLAKQIADQILANAQLTSSKDELQEIISGLSTAVAGAVVLSNEKIDEKLDDSFTKLLLAVKENKPNNSSVELCTEIGSSLVALRTAVESLELSPEINVSTDVLAGEMSKLVSRLSDDSKKIVTLAYEAADPTKYLAVRLTDGDKFYKASGGGVVVANGGGGSSSEVTNKATRIVTVGVMTYIGNAEIGAIESDPVWQIKRLETPGLTKKWADGDDLFDNVWDDYATITYI